MKDLFERPSGFEAAILVSVDFGDHDYEESLNELRQLSMTAGLAIRGTIESKRNVPDAKYFIGSGKADELKLSLIHILNSSNERHSSTFELMPSSDQ